jgi:hypothetical protein
LVTALSKDGQIDYSRYSYRELLEALDNINSRKYPGNYANLQTALENVGPEQRAALERGSAPVPNPDVDLLGDDSPDDEFQSDPDVRRVKHLLTALAVAGLSGYLLWVDDVVLPFSNPLTISLSELGVTLANMALLFAIAVPASFLIDYVDERDNRKKYLLFAMFSESVATGLIIFASIISASPA